MCLNLQNLDESTWNHTCVTRNTGINATHWAWSQEAFKTCCPDNCFTTNNNCDTYCNITAPYDVVNMGKCLSDVLNPNFDWFSELEWGCFPRSWNNLEFDTSLTSPGLIATTWTWADKTFTVTSAIGPAQWTTMTSTITLDFWEKPLTAAKTEAITTTPTPTSSTKPSRAEREIRLSYRVGALVALVVMAIAL